MFIVENRSISPGIKSLGDDPHHAPGYLGTGREGCGQYKEEGVEHYHRDKDHEKEIKEFKYMSAGAFSHTLSYHRLVSE
jgi:hypothetical protein